MQVCTFILMNDNQFVAKIVSQADRRTIQIPAQDKERFEKLLGKPIKVTVEEI